MQREDLRCSESYVVETYCEPYSGWEAMVTLKRIKDEVDLEWSPREAAQR